MTRIRKLMLGEVQHSNDSSETIRTYINAVKQFAEHGQDNRLRSILSSNRPANPNRA